MAVLILGHALIGFKGPCHFSRTFLDFETRNFKERCELLEIFSCQETMSLLFFSQTWPWMTFMRSEVGGRHTTQLVTTLNIIMEKLLFWSFSYISLTTETNRMEGGRIFFLNSKMVFCYQNCSDILWEKIVLVNEKNFLISQEQSIQTVKGQNNVW